jgi:hypothetical protein
MSELLDPNRKEFRQLFDQEFAGMAAGDVEYDELVAVREKLVESIQNTMTENEKRFLLSIKQGQPEWDRSSVEGVDQLPGIQWKLINIGKMSAEKHAESIRKLRSVLGYE